MNFFVEKAPKSGWVSENVYMACPPLLFLVPFLKNKGSLEIPLPHPKQHVQSVELHSLLYCKAERLFCLKIIAPILLN